MTLTRRHLIGGAAGLISLATAALASIHGVGNGTVVLNANTAYYCVPSTNYVIRDNVSSGTLVRGTDFTETLSVAQSTAPNGTVIAWSWPVGGWAQAPSYPEVAYGNVHPPCLYPPAKQVKNFTTLTTQFNYTEGGPNYTYNPLLEGWLSSDAAWTTSSFEVELQIDQTVKGNTPYALPINHHMTSPISADVILKPNSPTPTTQVLIFPLLAFGSNVITNTTLSGAVNGSPGTDPTHSDFTQGNLSLTKTISGSGTTTTASDGTTVHCVNVNYTGTTPSAGNMQAQIISESYMPDVSPGDKYYAKLYVANLDNTTNLDDIEIQIKSYDSGFNQLQASGGGNIKASLTSTPQPFAVATTMVASAAYEQGPILYLHAAAGSLAINSTFQVCTPFDGTGGFAVLNNTTVDWSPSTGIYQDLIAAGVITGNEYAHGFEIGPEVYSGAGSFTINTFAVVWLP